jgi:NAD(P)H-hydrate epimerase
VRCGVGLLTVTSSIRTANSILTRVPEAMILSMETDENGFYLEKNFDKIIEQSNKATAVLIGCGLGVTDETKKLVREVIKNIRCPIILDADGINCMVDCIDIIKDNKSEVIITPHPAEFARLIGCRTEEVQSDRLASAAGFTRESNATLVLKGAGTIVAVSDKAYVNINGNPGMSKGGSGDILSGMIASFVAQGIKSEQSAILSVYMHGRAGDLAATKYSQQAMLPTDMVQELPYLFNELEMSN